ncbi:MAG: RNase adapter RapZ [Pseudomonadota bacterium]
MRIVVVTGLSGAGKSTALRALEDLGYFCSDNLPLPLLGPAIDLLEGVDRSVDRSVGAPSRSGPIGVPLDHRVSKAALVVDARSEQFLGSCKEALRALRDQGHQVEVLFLDAPDEALLRRFSETRRRHPLAGDDLRAGMARERELLGGLRDEAGAIVDTANLSVHQLKGIVQERYGRDTGVLSITLLSFGYRHGLPAEADIVMDVRFLPNPYFVESLSAKNGLCADVAAFVLDHDDARQFLAKSEDLLSFSLPCYQREGKAYLTIGIGCTGGRHRSVAVAEELGRRLTRQWPLTVRHRDLGRIQGSSTDDHGRCGGYGRSEQ